MKLLFIHDHPFYSENGIVYSGGGLPSFVWRNYLIFFNLVTVYGRKSQHLKDKKKISSTEFVNFKLTTNYNSFLDAFFKYSLISAELKKEIDNTDIVLVRLPSVLGFCAADIAIKNNKKIIVEQVGNAKEAMSTQGSFLGKIAAPFFEAINKRIVKKADYISYVTLSKLQTDYPSPAFQTSISNVLIERVCNPSDLNLNRFNNQKIKIGVIGGFDVRYKGQNIVLKAVALLSNEIKKQIELYFVGKGNSEWLLEESKKLGLSNNIKFMGPKESGDEIFQFLKILSIYIQPSFTEGMPRALLESMSMGCPVLGSTVGGIPDVISKEFLHTPGDYRKLSKQINLLIENRKLMENEAIRSLETVKPFQKDKLDEKRKAFYTQILNDLQNA